MIIIKDMAELEAQIKLGTFVFPDEVDLYVMSKRTARHLFDNGIYLKLDDSGHTPFITIDFDDISMLESGDLKFYVPSSIAQCLPKGSFHLVQKNEYFYIIGISIESLKKVLSQQ